MTIVKCTALHVPFRVFAATPFLVFRLLHPRLTSAESAPPSMYSDGPRSLRYFCRSPRVSATTFVPSTCVIYTHAIRAILDFCLLCGFILARRPPMASLFVRQDFVRAVSMFLHIRLLSDSTLRWTPLPSANDSYCQVRSGLSPPSYRPCRAHI